MSRSTHRQTTPRAHRAKHAQLKRADHKAMRLEAALLCRDADIVARITPETPILDVSPHLVSFNYNPDDFDTTCVVAEYCEDFLLESVNMNSTFLVPNALTIGAFKRSRAQHRS